MLGRSRSVSARYPDVQARLLFMRPLFTLTGRHNLRSGTFVHPFVTFIYFRIMKKDYVCKSCGHVESR